MLGKYLHVLKRRLQRNLHQILNTTLTEQDTDVHVYVGFTKPKSGAPGPCCSKPD